jgi:hypothetical protein
MTLKTNIDQLTRSELLNLNKSLKIACNDIIGGNQRVFVRTYNKSNPDCYAFYDYDDYSIRIFRKDIKTIDKYVQVFIHEWTHSLQKGLKKKYTKMFMVYGYWHNPYEIEARLNEKIYKSIVWKYAKSLI